MIDNGVMTKAAEEVAKAEVLIVLGASLTSPLCSQDDPVLYRVESDPCIRTGNTIRMRGQTIIVRGRCDDFLKRLVSELEK